MAAHRKKKKQKPVHWYVGYVLGVVAGRKVRVLVNGTELRVKYVSGYSPIVGRTCRVGRVNGKWSATGPISDDDVTVPAGDDAPDLPTSGVHGPLRPIYTGTFRGVTWAVGDLVQGHRGAFAQIGCAFYGTGPAVLLRGAVDVAHLRLRGADDSAVGELQIWPIAESTRPAGAPTLLGVAPIATVDLIGPAVVTVDIPTTTELTSGTWGGFAIYDPSTTANRVVGLELDSLTLTMDWSL